jgi:hypothetical protein
MYNINMKHNAATYGGAIITFDSALKLIGRKDTITARQYIVIHSHLKTHIFYSYKFMLKNIQYFTNIVPVSNFCSDYEQLYFPNLRFMMAFVWLQSQWSITLFSVYETIHFNEKTWKNNLYYKCHIGNDLKLWKTKKTLSTTSKCADHIWEAPTELHTKNVRNQIPRYQ